MPMSARHVRRLQLHRTVNAPLEAVMRVLNAGPQAWLPDFQEERGQPTTELRYEEAGQRITRRVLVHLGNVQSTEPFGHGGTVPVEWEALHHPELYPRLDGHIRVEERDGLSEVSFDACYVPPGGRLGAAVDRVLMGRVARASLGDFFDRVTARLDQAASLSS